MHKRDRIARMKDNDWSALARDKRNDLVRRAQCDLLGSFRRCTNKRCRRNRWCASDNPRGCKERLWMSANKKPKTLRNAIGRLEDMTYL